MKIATVLTATLLLATLSAEAANDERKLFEEAVVPILSAKCVSCHGEDRDKGDLRLDTFDFIMKGGSEGPAVVAGNLADSTLHQRIVLPLDDSDKMPPEDEPQLTEHELALLNFWVESGAKKGVTVAALKPNEAASKSIAAVFANLPEMPAEEKEAEAEKLTFTPEQLEMGKKTIGRVEEAGASLMAIAQDTPALRFSALNVAKEYGDKDLDLLAPVVEQVRWVDLARTQVTDKGLAHVGKMKNLTRLHLENTGVGDAGIEHLKNLDQLEYLNLYGTKVSDAGLMKLAGLKNLKKVFVWQSEVTDAGAAKLAAAIPGVDINTGWKEPAKPAAATGDKKVAAAAAAPAPAPKKEEKKPTPPPPAPKKEEKKPTPPPPAPKKAETKPAPAKPAEGSLDKALTQLKAATEEVKKQHDAAKASFDKAQKAAAEANAKAQAAKAQFEKSQRVVTHATKAIEELGKAVAESKK